MFGKKKRQYAIYAVDDEREIRKAFKELLPEIVDCEVTVFASLKEIEERLKTDTVLPDLIMSDIHMPGKSGLCLSKFLRDTNYRIPVIYVTADKGEDLNVGEFHILSKPFNVFELEKVIKKQLKIETPVALKQVRKK